VPADRLLVGLALVPLPAGFALPALPTGADALRPASTSHSSGWFAKLTTPLTTKAAAAAAVTMVVIGGGTAAAYGLGAFQTRPSKSASATTPATATVSTATQPQATATVAPSLSPTMARATPTRSKTTMASGKFQLLVPGAALPSGAQCATAVRAKAIAENKAVNATANKTTGHSVPGATTPLTRVDGNFTGTTEQILREGKMTWLNTVERGSQYKAGDAWGCMGVWFSGRWHTAAADGYITRVKDYLAQRIWTTPNFQQP